MHINFGGFVPLSTVDWRGKSVCVVFFRGCPVKCWYCHNQSILSGEDRRPVDEIKELIRSSSLLISGVIFSGGEATMQPAALFSLAEYSKSIGLSTGLHTNGVYPDVIKKLIDKRLIDHIALDVKAEWNLYTVRGKERAVGKQVKDSLTQCTAAYHSGTLPGFEVVVTLFPGYGEEVMTISHDVAPDIDLVLQQGVLMGIRPLDIHNLQKIADRLGRKVRIRTRSDGEIIYESNSSSGDARIRER
ncbi:anaerobic ribonucleoside-triphosphate reductase activating protein [Methanospirillum purgamenti]|uniref:Anaerobic ribonucleoside-triphosphate reductase activating protein n=1 Tax=Methanospirillum hungatei TaxID=2203 RepID=A0A8F5VRF6_METHU|nr:anaerobic ribonucleoside-triphosphate reductase activating protein [Methanospirillum hungatei]